MKVPSDVISAFEMQRIDGKKIEKMNPPALFAEIVGSLESGKMPDQVTDQVLQDTLLASIRYSASS